MNRGVYYFIFYISSILAIAGANDVNVLEGVCFYFQQLY